MSISFWVIHLGHLGGDKTVLLGFSAKIYFWLPLSSDWRVCRWGLGCFATRQSRRFPPNSGSLTSRLPTCRRDDFGEVRLHHLARSITCRAFLPCCTVIPPPISHQSRQPRRSNLLKSWTLRETRKTVLPFDLARPASGSTKLSCLMPSNVRICMAWLLT